MSDLLNAITKSLKENPHGWQYDGDAKYTIIRNGVEVWISNGFWFYGIWAPTKAKFTFWEKLRFHLAFGRWSRQMKRRTPKLPKIKPSVDHIIEAIQ